MRRSRLATAVGLTLAVSLTLTGVAAAQGTDFADDFDYSSNMQPWGSSARPVPASPGVFNSDLAFWGDTVIQGTYEGFRIIDASDPSDPTEIVDFTDCVAGTTNGNQGDIVVYEGVLVRAWNSPAGSGGRFCGGIFVPQGQEGVHVFDISDPTDPVGLTFVPTPCGSHTLSAVPDPDNDRLLIYSSASSGSIFGQPGDGHDPDVPFSCRGLDIIDVPLGAPDEASYLRFKPSGDPQAAASTWRACHDTSIILGSANLVACAGGNGFTMWTVDPRQGATLDNPQFLYSRSLGVGIGHSASFTWDGKVMVFGHEPGGGSQAQCQASSSLLNRSLFFIDTATGDTLGTVVHARPQTNTENCTWHNFNVVPSNKGYLLVSGNYQSGIAVIDFTDPANAFEVAYADPHPLVPQRLGGDWSSYWYNGFIYQSDITRGLHVWALRGNHIAKNAKKFTHSNPQTQETTFPVRSALSD